MSTALPDAAPVTEAVHRDTVYTSVVDRDRMAVSLIYSIFHGLGSGIASTRFGILFQNRGAGFNLTPGHPNEAAGGKRPMHTIFPGILAQDGRVTTRFGVMGGQYQADGHACFDSILVDCGMDPQEAIDGPRCLPRPASPRSSGAIPTPSAPNSSGVATTSRFRHSRSVARRRS